jgi:hypothetical protein
MTESQGAGFEPDPVPKPSEFQGGFVAVHGGWACDAQDCLEIWKCQNSWIWLFMTIHWPELHIVLLLDSVCVLVPTWSTVRPKARLYPYDVLTLVPDADNESTPLTILGAHNSFHSLGTSKALGLVGGLWFSKQTITIWEALGSSTKWFRVDNPLLFGWGTPLIDQSNVRLSHYLRWQVETPTRFKDMFFLWGNGDWTKPFCIHIGLSESRAPLNPQWGWYAQLSSLFRDPYREN